MRLTRICNGDRAGARDAIGILVKKSKGYSTSQVSREVLAEVEAIRATLPAGTKLDVVQKAEDVVPAFEYRLKSTPDLVPEQPLITKM